MATRPPDVSLRSTVPAAPSALRVARPRSRDRAIGRLRRSWDLPSSAPSIPARSDARLRVPTGYVDYDAAMSLDHADDSAGRDEIRSMSGIEATTEFIDYDVLETCRLRVSAP